MTNLQKVQLRLSEIRARLAAIGALTGESLTDEVRNELMTLTAEVGELETRQVALIAAGEEPVIETGRDDEQLNALITRSSIAEIFAATLEHRATDGATRELQDEWGLQGNQMAIEMLRRDGGGGLELRTTGGTQAAANVGQNEQSIIPAVFAGGAIDYLSIPTPSVGVGETIYPVLSTSVSPGTPAESADQAHSAAGFTAEVLSPQRIQSSLFYTREDAARMQGLDSALRVNLSDALSDKLDSVILTGTDGLLTGTNLANNAAGAADTFETYRNRFVYGNIDGKFAMTAMDLRLLVGDDTYADMAGTYRSGNAADNPALTTMMAETGGVRVSANVTATASNKQNGIVRRGMRMDAVAPLWRAMDVIVDEYSQSKAGEIIITVVMLYAFEILRAEGFVKVQAQHS